MKIKEKVLRHVSGGFLGLADAFVSGDGEKSFDSYSEAFYHTINSKLNHFYLVLESYYAGNVVFVFVIKRETPSHGMGDDSYLLNMKRVEWKGDYI